MNTRCALHFFALVFVEVKVGKLVKLVVATTLDTTPSLQRGALQTDEADGRRCTVFPEPATKGQSGRTAGDVQ